MVSPPEASNQPLGMTRLLSAALVITIASAQTQLFHFNDEYAVFSSAAVSRRSGQQPTFSTASWLNPPQGVSGIEL